MLCASAVSTLSASPAGYGYLPKTSHFYFINLLRLLTAFMSLFPNTFRTTRFELNILQMVLQIAYVRFGFSGSIEDLKDISFECHV